MRGVVSEVGLWLKIVLLEGGKKKAESRRMAILVERSSFVYIHCMLREAWCDGDDAVA